MGVGSNDSFGEDVAIAAMGLYDLKACTAAGCGRGSVGAWAAGGRGVVWQSPRAGGIQPGGSVVVWVPQI